jgi:FKBP-type peptidyl-prolyl cis-trans isomerase FklB
MDQIENVSYSLGVNVGTNLKREGLNNLNIEKFVKALNDVFGANELEIPAEKTSEILNEYFNALKKEKYEKIAKESIEYLTLNSTKEGVTVLPSGLQYEVLTQGTGNVPTLESTVTTHYHGTLVDGTVFDSSVLRNEPATFAVKQVIKGWVEALQLMPVGSKWRITVPPNLAYGDRGAGTAIQPYSTLIFEIELLNINS